MKICKWKRIVSIALAMVLAISSLLGTMAVQAAEGDPETQTWVDMEPLAELGPDIGKQVLGEPLMEAVIVDENTPMLMATEGSGCTILKGQTLEYMTWTTHNFKVTSETGTYPAYCMEPNKSAPSGAATVSVLENDTIKALLLCAYEGPYPHLSTSALEALGVPLERAKLDVYCITHACVSYVYCGSLKGVDESAQRDYINHIKTVQAWAANNPDIMAEYTVYAAYSDDQQDICWLEKTGVPKGRIQMQKVSANPEISDANSSYSLAGAVYGIYDKDQSMVAQMTTDANGSAVSEELPYGSYWIKEISAPPGYAVSASMSGEIILNAETVSVTVNDIPQNDPINIVVGKIDAQTTQNLPQGSASLAGAQFTVKYFKGLYDSDPEKAGQTAARTWVLQTDQDGICRLMESYKVSGDAFYKDSNGYETFPLGTVTIQETKAPEGYLLNDELFVRKITSEGTLEPVNTYQEPTVKEDVIRGGVAIAKKDLETEVNVPQGNATLAGAEFEIVNCSAQSVVVDGTVYANGEVVTVIVTGEDGVASTDADTLPYGDYLIRESRASEGYLMEGKHLVQEFSIRANGEVVQLTQEETTVYEQIIRGGVLIQKRDLETGINEPQGSASLAGAEFEIINRSKESVVVEGTLYATGEVVKVITTGEDGVAFTDADTLPYGDYLIRECKAPEGYLLEGKNLEQTFAIRENGFVVELNKEDSAVYDQIKRGDLQLIKVEDGTLKRMADIPFSITSKTTGESHVFVTDANGQYNTSSEWNLHTYNTNRGESSEDGIWFGNCEPDDSKGALPYDTYTITEISCDANEGHELVSFDVVISRDRVVVDLGTVTNDTIPVITIGTMATDSSTKTHEAYAVEEVTILDEVSFVNLAVGEKYTMTGILMDKETGKPLLIDGKEVNAEKTFTAKQAQGTVIMEFTFPATALYGKNIVVFEYLYHDGEIAASHEDLTDEDQTISFKEPAIGTKATYGDSKRQNGFATNEVTIVDEVSYTGLLTGYEYTIKGTLMDQETGEELLVNGETVTSECTFLAKMADGIQEIAFTFDATALSGKVVVVFETLFFEGQEIAAHEDLEDKDQTVLFEEPIISTKASDAATGEQEGFAAKEVTIVDEVSYTGLIVGYEYTIKGTLMDKETGEAFLVNGKPVTSESMFTAETPDGIQTLTFTFDGSALRGKTIVVFEKMFYEEKEIAVHEDIRDKEQSVEYQEPQVQTSATDKETGTKEGVMDESVTIIDNASYSGLIAGCEYTMKGTLMDKETGKEFLVDGKPVTSEVSFTAQRSYGNVQLTFTFDGSSVGDAVIVVFETIFYKDMQIVSHEDIYDEAQTVTYKEEVVTLTPNKTTTTIGNTKPVKTGDSALLGVYMLLAAASLLVIGILQVRKKQHGKILK